MKMSVHFKQKRLMHEIVKTKAAIDYTIVRVPIKMTELLNEEEERERCGESCVV